MESALLHWKRNALRSVEEEMERIEQFLNKADSKLQAWMRIQPVETKKYTEAKIPWNTSQYDSIKAAALVPIELYLKMALEGFRSLSSEKKKEIFSSGFSFVFKTNSVETCRLRDVCF